MARGLASLAVLLFHVRYRFFLDFSEVPDKSLLARAWYVATAFGHDAVVVFFVLSGFLIGSTVIRSCREGRWSWKEYLVSRYTRLFVVLVPGLLLSAMWDRLGLHWFGSNPVYTGGVRDYTSDYFDVALRSGVGTFLGNLFFLQEIFVAPFGSNDALWSLAYEHWYYVAFALFAVASLTNISMGRRGLLAALGMATLVMVGPNITLYFGIWLLGVAVAFLPPLRTEMRWPTLWIGLATMAFVGTVAAVHAGIQRSSPTDKALLVDAITAAAFTVCLCVVLHDRRTSIGGAYSRCARWLANCSFTLYVVHLPLLVFFRALIIPDRPWSPSPATLALSMLIASMTLIYAASIASLTEAHTGAVRRWMLRTLERAGPT